MSIGSFNGFYIFADRLQDKTGPLETTSDSLLMVQISDLCCVGFAYSVVDVVKDLQHRCEKRDS